MQGPHDSLLVLMTQKVPAFVLVQPLDPKHENTLTELLSRVTPMPVREVREGIARELARIGRHPHGTAPPPAMAERQP